MDLETLIKQEREKKHASGGASNDIFKRLKKDHVQPESKVVQERPAAQL